MRARSDGQRGRAVIRLVATLRKDAGPASPFDALVHEVLAGRIPRTGEASQ